MNVGDVAAIAAAAVAVIGLILVGVRALLAQAVAKVNVGHRIGEVAADLDEHRIADTAQFTAIERRFDEGGRAMRELSEQQARTDEKVNLLVQWTTGSAPEART